MTSVAQPDVSRAPAPAPARLVAGGVGEAEIQRLVERRLREERPNQLRFLRSRLRSREDAEDVLQDFALKAIQGASRLTDETKVDAWLAVTLRNALFDRYRRNAGRARLREAAAAEPAETTDDAEDLERPLACLSATMGELKADSAALLQRAEIEEIPLKLVAQDCDITANNAGVRVHRAREALRRLMKVRCADCQVPCALATRFLARAA
jgi:RNA polymerase sigma-70 factor (ECF subfamily)